MARSPMARLSKARTQVVTKVKTTDRPFVWQPLCEDSFAFVDFFKEFRLQRIAMPLFTTAGENRTPRRTHISLSLVSTWLGRVAHLRVF